MSDRAWEEGEREGSDRDGEGKGGERDQRKERREGRAQGRGWEAAMEERGGRRREPGGVEGRRGKKGMQRAAVWWESGVAGGIQLSQDLLSEG